MGKKSFSNSNGDFKTVVTIEPTYQIEYNMPDFDYCYPAAKVEVDLEHKGKLMYSTTFTKILDNTVYHDEGQGVVFVADKMINGDLAAIGLGGLLTLDLYDSLRTMGVNTDLNAEIMKAILKNSLHIPYHDDDIDVTENCFYKLEVLEHKIR